MIDELIKKYEETIKAYYEWFKPNSKINQLVCNEDELKCYKEILKDLKVLQASLISKELEYHKQLQDEEKGDEYTKIDNAFIDGKRFALNELIGKE